MFPSLNIQYVFYRIYTLIFPDLAASSSLSGGLDGAGGGVGAGGAGAGGSLFSSFAPGLQEFWILLSILAVFLTIFFAVMALYSAVRLRALLEKNKFVLPETAPDANRPPRLDEWDKILKMVSSENPSDWKLAVIEADGILDELTLALKLEGDTLGARLKSAIPGEFRTLDDAWEAHKTRNRVAHEGPSFLLTKREARTAIEKFERVFREFRLV